MDVSRALLQACTLGGEGPGAGPAAGAQSSQPDLATKVAAPSRDGAGGVRGPTNKFACRAALVGGGRGRLRIRDVPARCKGRRCLPRASGLAARRCATALAGRPCVLGLLCKGASPLGTWRACGQPAVKAPHALCPPPGRAVVGVRKAASTERAVDGAGVRKGGWVARGWRPGGEGGKYRPSPIHSQAGLLPIAAEDIETSLRCCPGSGMPSRAAARLLAYVFGAGAGCLAPVESSGSACRPVRRPVGPAAAPRCARRARCRAAG